MTPRVILYHQPGCPPCQWVMDFLTNHRISYESKDVREDSAALKELVALGSQSTPTLVIDGEVLIGFEPDRILSLLGKKPPKRR